MYSLESLKKFLLDKWWLFALVGIFLFAYWIRSAGNVPDRILSFDPTFFYRFTKYFADWGHFPVWDELSYYVGRADTRLASPLMWMITGTIYNIFKGTASMFTVASTAAALYGALIVFPAFLFGRELSNKYGGLLAAALVGAAPQILVRTFGASYDTDQLALFFLLMTLYTGFRCLRKKTVESAATAILVYSAAMLSWGDSMFTFVILSGYSVILFIVKMLYSRIKEGKLSHLDALKNFFSNAALLFIILLGTQIVGMITQTYDAFGSILSIATFARTPEVWIVNISIAELQPFNIFSVDGWMQAMGRFVTGDPAIDTLIFLAFLSSIAVGVFYSYKKNINSAALITAIFIIAFYVTTRGVRFTEFSSALFLIIISVGFGHLMEIFSNRSLASKSFILGLAFLILFVSLGLSSQMGFALGPDVDKDWDDTWKWIKENTPEDAIIGTWWDPGHMIAAYAERRNFADGAHCPGTCKYTINDRIVDLGKIMATSDESASIQLIQKYRGTSSKVYWIASDDLIPKYQWLQYFGLGCDMRKDPQNCQMYQPFYIQNQASDSDGKIIFRSYGNLLLFETEPRIAVFHNNGKAYLFEDVVYYKNDQISGVKLDQANTIRAYEILSPILKELKIVPSNETIKMPIWFSKDFSTGVAIAPNLANTVFTKMYFLDGNGLEHFKEVYANSRVKIFEVLF